MEEEEEEEEESWQGLFAAYKNCPGQPWNHGPELGTMQLEEGVSISFQLPEEGVIVLFPQLTCVIEIDIGTIGNQIGRKWERI